MKCVCNGQILDVDGEMVCGTCGRVNGYRDDAAAATFTADGVPDGRGPALNPFDAGDGHPTTFGSRLVDYAGKPVVNRGMVKKMVERNRWSNRASRSLPGAMFQLGMLRTALAMNEASSIYAAYLIRKIISSGFLTGRTLKRCTIAAVLVACRKHDITRTMADMEKASGVPKRQIFATYNQLCETFDITIPVQDPVNYIASIADHAGLSESVKRYAYGILERMDKTEMAGKDPKSLAATSLYMACVALREPVMRRAIAKAAGVAGTTLSNRYRSMAGKLPQGVVRDPPGLIAVKARSTTIKARIVSGTTA